MGRSYRLFREALEEVSQTLYLSQQVYEQLKPWSEKAYPYEGCGLLLGQFSSQKLASRLVPLSNILREKNPEKQDILSVAKETLGNRVESKGQFEFVMNPSEFSQQVLAAEKEGLDVVGIIHTHPDHPAKPSATDSAQPLMSRWSVVIVSVEKGKFSEARSWVREEDTDPFQEEEIIVGE